MLRGVDDGCHSKASRRVALKCDPRWLTRRYVLTQIEERLDVRQAHLLMPGGDERTLAGPQRCLNDGEKEKERKN
jgi:hypothetical protein